MKKIDPKIEKWWKNALYNEFQSEYFFQLKNFIIEERSIYEVYPPANKIFSAFDNCPFNKIKVVILWQDPYHWPNQANWLSFSVNDWISRPPSLINIFKEIEADLWIKMKEWWNLEKWAKQWVLLLNSTLTVREWEPNSHSWRWWEIFTDKVIETISKEKKWIIFLLWWKFAQEKEKLIDTKKHYILKAAHPSPFSAYKWFFWCKHFSKTNEILKENWKEAIIWKI